MICAVPGDSRRTDGVFGFKAQGVVADAMSLES